MSDWKHTTEEELNKIIAEDLKECTAGQIALFDKVKVRPRTTPIVRYGKLEKVFVVAESEGEVIYYEDIDEGFNISPLTGDGKIAQHWCNDDKLGWALERWLTPNGQYYNLGPAQPLASVPTRFLKNRFFEVLRRFF